MSQKAYTNFIVNIISNVMDPKHTHCANHDTLLDILIEAEKLFETEPSFIEVSGKFIVIGDIHGNIDILLRIFTKNGYPDKTRYIFLGDYVDRGENSIEVISILFAFKVLFPENIYLIRGNHESRSMTEYYGFKDECDRYANEAIYNATMNAFDNLPIGIILNNEVLCVHGGIPRNINSREELYAIAKTDGEPNPGPVTDILWSDPNDDENVKGQCVRGAGFVYGQCDVKNFLNNLKLSLICRSHEQCMNGYDFPFESQCLITIFSSADYCGTHNSAGILKFLDSNISNVSLNFFKPHSQRKYTLPAFELIKKDVLSHADLAMNEEEPSSPEVVNSLLD
ncbi:Ser/Thr protein phosphatase, putative [Trichomonas vaginalis G3]|uniref:Serine/threonine-protein phosphatase n=1 Tax=Trichomonas vaginalis (strain ATCC PRA-98 / G3) TaxID=412133 RepID=A2ERL7_TRIV3|nr:phosphoprotein phosphatase protein [Trichomonas vaginalis G3]EAY04669.1 Ser/Thr protein phosphatase, putative [Trichomonas vaginalis G3]KAI5530922.1 phosphoprotein phosphatase protein [Trichomonas vaginalis G3]|eukprot:XP_001316892.1 Ser/Thr protein phosphatase [Trichomonas vaginalis G3]